jgi:hypothetical protein
MAMLLGCGLAQGALLSPRPVPVARAGVGRAVMSAFSMQQQQTSSPKGVVITGGASGVGYAYADEFLARGHWVVICDVKDPEPAVQSLRQKHAGGLGRVYGTITDVRRATRCRPHSVLPPLLICHAAVAAAGAPPSFHPPHHFSIVC